MDHIKQIVRQEVEKYAAGGRAGCKYIVVRDT